MQITMYEYGMYIHVYIHADVTFTLYSACNTQCSTPHVLLLHAVLWYTMPMDA